MPLSLMVSVGRRARSGDWTGPMIPGFEVAGTSPSFEVSGTAIPRVVAEWSGLFGAGT